MSLTASNTAGVPNKHDDMDKQVETDGVAVVEQQVHGDFEDVADMPDEAYLRAPKKVRWFRGTLFQMFLFGLLSFSGPAMSDAIDNLGGGGLATPYTANAANAAQYSIACAMTLFGGPLINKLGIKWSCIIAATFFPIQGASYYVNSKYGTQWFVIFVGAIGGFFGGLLYVAESTAMLSYPRAQERGKYIGIWVSMRNSGQLLGGAISLGVNVKTAGVGAVSITTYLIFIVLECLGLPGALLLSPTRKVRRPDGVPVPLAAPQSWKMETKLLLKHIIHKRTLLMAIPAFYSFFYGGVYTTYLSLHFSVRARALSSFLYPLCTILLCTGFGRLIDSKRWSQKTRAWIGFAFWAVPQAAVFVWTAILYAQFEKNNLKGIDYTNNTADWFRCYLPYLIIQTTGYACQLYLYWLLGCFSSDVKSSARTGGLFRCFETAGQAISHGINSRTSDKRIPLYINIGIFFLMVPTLSILIRMVPKDPHNYDDVTDEKKTQAVTQEAIATTEARGL
ncbi:uncharacterized protein I303_101516 [Kwoniella dejecticola CBS 10117]|uniref:UNC93-like protein n=1 Tax=Kwoniella dejecticola CBS 10117 TaxID=1296121 RepID=A0A1A6ADI5_9TREE|nr:uncharacterized protein I303_02352 [Kwoniella dejecticola CBS 10117]OBR88132.1 hypothetical protein I303_02352 [Kwoniella dejecticola CBS 10117]